MWLEERQVILKGEDSVMPTCTVYCTVHCRFRSIFAVSHYLFLTVILWGTQRDTIQDVPTQDNRSLQAAQIGYRGVRGPSYSHWTFCVNSVRSYVVLSSLIDLPVSIYFLISPFPTLVLGLPFQNLVNNVTFQLKIFSGFSFLTGKNSNSLALHYFF